MMLPVGWFHYVAALPEAHADGAFDCPTTQGDAGGGSVDDGTRLVGRSPRLVVYDAGFNERTGPDRPHVLRHGLRLEASGRRKASVRTALLHLEATLLPSLRAGDELHLAGNSGGDVGVSVLRGGFLVCAVGAISSVPLGADLEALEPRELRARIADVLLSFDPSFPDAENLRAVLPLPLALRHGGFNVLIGQAHRSVGPYDVRRPLSASGWQAHSGHGTIVRRGACSALGARLSTMLLAQDDALGVEAW
ncbi:MAG: hypothetical protein U0P30_08965 [Vicinamibacterales bacterium]